MGGSIDEVAIFDRKLTGREINLLYQAGLLNWADDRHDDVLDGIAAIPESAFRHDDQADVLYERAERVRTMVELAIDISTPLLVRQYMVRGARLYLANQIQERTDGCMSAAGIPDRDDWVIDCTEQESLYDAIEAVLEPLDRL